MALTQADGKQVPMTGCVLYLYKCDTSRTVVPNAGVRSASV